MCVYIHARVFRYSKCFIPTRYIDREIKKSWYMLCSCMVKSKWALRKSSICCMWKNNSCHSHGCLRKALISITLASVMKSVMQLNYTRRSCHFKVFLTDSSLRSQKLVNIWRVLCIWTVSIMREQNHYWTDFNYHKSVHLHWFQSSCVSLPWLRVEPNDYRTKPRWRSWQGAWEKKTCP